MTLILLKSLHIAALLIWCAGLLAMPLMLTHHQIGERQSTYARLRMLTHYSYIVVVTPAAVVAIAAGTALIYLREAFVPWLFVKLLVVGALVALHVYIGHVVLMMSERRGRHQPPSMAPVVIIAAFLMVAILLLVLAKPDIPDLIPEWLKSPRNRQLPLDDTPT